MSKTQKPNIAKLTSEIEAIIEWFESDDVDLNQALEKYADATAKIQQLKNHLAKAKLKVEHIKKRFDV